MFVPRPPRPELRRSHVRAHGIPFFSISEFLVALFLEKEKKTYKKQKSKELGFYPTPFHVI